MDDKSDSPKPEAPKAADRLRDATAYVVTDERDALLYPSDDGQLARLMRGEFIPLDERRMTEARSGRVVTDLPAISVPHLLRRGMIRKARPEETAALNAAKGARS